MELLTVKEVAERFRVTPKFICDLFKRGDLLGFKAGKHIRIYASSVDNYVAAQENKKRPKVEQPPLNLRPPRKVKPSAKTAGFRFITGL